MTRAGQFRDAGSGRAYYLDSRSGVTQAPCPPHHRASRCPGDARAAGSPATRRAHVPPRCARPSSLLRVLGVILSTATRLRCGAASHRGTPPVRRCAVAALHPCTTPRSRGSRGVSWCRPYTTPRSRGSRKLSRDRCAVAALHPYTTECTDRPVSLTRLALPILAARYRLRLP